MAETGMSYLYTIGGYATLLGVGYAVYHVSTQKNKKKTGAAQAKTTKTSQPEPRKEDRKKKQRLESFTSEARPKASEPSAWMNNVVDSTPDDGPDNRKFARQLSKAKEGTKFTGKSESNNQREKSVKQSKANVISGGADKKPSSSAPAPAVPAAPAASATPATPEVEKPVTVEEPEVSIPETRTVEETTGVSDMLEPTRAGPSVLRVTDTGRKEQKKVAKAPEPVESKKQRQNRKKAEAAKAARQEAEKDRKVQEEKQRRQARIAEGRPAKDGSQFKAANGTSSAWTQGAPEAAATNADALYQPLDTFEKPAAAPAKQTTAAKADGGWISSLPSEETQLEMLKDESDEWSTVKTKSAKKTSKKASSTDSGDELSHSWVVAQNKQPAPEVKKAKPAQTQNYGAFSALTTGDEPEEDVEEEWDV